ncbi:MAG TPA: hypothetical protein PKD98_12200 [Anaerolineae bacterium]|nr:hypothetical protein [Anaerolineae bacterium]
MNLLFKLLVIYFSFSAVAMATTWYLSTIVPRLAPAWWRQVVVDEDPEFKAWREFHRR